MGPATLPCNPDQGLLDGRPTPMAVTKAMSDFSFHHGPARSLRPSRREPLHMPRDINPGPVWKSQQPNTPQRLIRAIPKPCIESVSKGNIARVVQLHLSSPSHTIFLSCEQSAFTLQRHNPSSIRRQEARSDGQTISRPDLRQILICCPLINRRRFSGGAWRSTNRNVLF